MKEALRILTRPGNCPKLTALADGCNNGACNLNALLRSVSATAEELSMTEHKHHPAVKVILGHLSYLCGESLGPSSQALFDYEEWRAQP